MIRLSLHLLLPAFLLASACSTSRQTRYFQDTPAMGDSAMRVSATDASIIQPDDILAINVTSVSSIAVEKDPVIIFRSGGTAFNVAATQGAQGSPASAAGGYLVDASGSIDFPVVGKVAVGGLTIEAAKSLLATRLKDYVKSPIVEVRIINYKVTVLGEVRSPGIVLAPNHRINLLEALAAAGDILISGRRDNVQVIRQAGGGRLESVRLDLSSREVFRSPYFYLKQNDVVIVDASRVRRTESSDFVRIYLPIITTLLSSFAIVYSVTRTQ